MGIDANVVLGVFDRINNWNNLKNGRKTKYRLLYLECSKNLNLIDCLNLDSGIDKADIDIKSMLNSSYKCNFLVKQ